MLNFLLKDLKNNEDGIALVGVIITVIIVAMISITILISSSKEGALVQKGVGDTQARYVAESAINGIAYQLTTYSNWDSGVWSAASLADTSMGTATINSMIFTGYGATVDLSINGTLGNKVRQLQVTLQFTVPGLMGAGTFKTFSPTANGNVTLDGRNHDCQGTLINDASGTWGIVTNQSEANFDLGGSADVGATNHGLDYDPQNTSYNRMLFDYDDIADTPDEVFGFAEGTLRSIANATGHLYNTALGTLDPATANGTKHDMPLTFGDGVYFIEPDCGAKWRAAPSMSTANSKAIVVVHNTCVNASMGNSTFTDLGDNTNLFRGILITDTFEKAHSTYVGGVIAVGDAGPVNVGNGEGKLLYSRCVLSDLFDNYLYPGSTVEVKASKWQENALDWQGIH